MFSKFKCAILQTPVSSLKATTLGYVKEAVDQAVSRGGQCCILGETFNSFYAKKYLIENAEDFEGLLLFL